MRTPIAAFILAAGLVAPAWANDSSAVLGAGGIRLVPNWDIVTGYPQSPCLNGAYSRNQEGVW